jgi:tRNA(fMet)-specific endonuclease VapC
MTYLLDTNIVIHLIRDDATWSVIDDKYQLFKRPNRPAISVVTVGELRSFALQRNWGGQKLRNLLRLFDNLLIIDINSPEIINKYAEIDSYSQNRLADKPMPTSARKMGKNDVWIAATAAVLDIPLLSTDADFQHLHNVYLDLHNL